MKKIVLLFSIFYTLTVSAQNVGIGNSDPQNRLDFPGRIRIKTGTLGNAFTSSGIWMEDYRNGNNRIFLGMQDSIRLGIWGEGTPSAGWAFNFNARNGNVGIGVISSANKLEVGGNISATGNMIGGSFQFTTPKTCYLSIGGADFLPDKDCNYSISPHGAYISTGSSSMYAPVHLPQGAVVTEMKVFFFDYHNLNLTVNLARISDIGNLTIMAQTISNSFSSGRQTLSHNTITAPVIDNTNYLYSIHATTYPDIWPGFAIKVYRVQITYTISEAN